MSYMKKTKAFRAAPQSGGIIMPEDLDFGLPPSNSKKVQKRSSKTVRRKKLTRKKEKNISSQLLTYLTYLESDYSPQTEEELYEYADDVVEEIRKEPMQFDSTLKIFIENVPQKFKELKEILRSKLGSTTEETVTLNLDVPDIESEELRFMVEEKYRALSKLGKEFEKDLTSMKVLLMLEIRLREFSDAFHEEEVKDEPDESLLDAYVEKILEVDLPYEFDELQTQAKNKVFECDTTQLLPELIQYIRDKNSPIPNLNKMKAAFEKHKELKPKGNIIMDLLEKTISECKSDEFQDFIDESTLLSTLKQRVKDCIDDIGSAYDNNGLKKVDFQGYFKLVESILDTVEESGDVSGDINGDVNVQSKFNMAGRSKSKGRKTNGSKPLDNDTPTRFKLGLIQVVIQLFFLIMVAFLASMTTDTNMIDVLTYTFYGSNNPDNVHYVFGKETSLNVGVLLSAFLSIATPLFTFPVNWLKYLFQFKSSIVIFVAVCEFIYVSFIPNNGWIELIRKLWTALMNYNVQGGIGAISDYIKPQEHLNKLYLLGIATKLYALDPGMPTTQSQGSHDLIHTRNSGIVFQPFDFGEIFVNVNTQAMLSKVERYEDIHNPYRCGPFTCIKYGRKEVGFVLPTKRAFKNPYVTQIQNRIIERLSNGMARSLHYRDCIVFDAEQAYLKTMYVNETSGFISGTLAPYTKLMLSFSGLYYTLLYENKTTTRETTTILVEGGKDEYTKIREGTMYALVLTQAALLIGLPLFSSAVLQTSFTTTNLPEVNQFLRRYYRNYSVFFIKNVDDGGTVRNSGTSDINRHDFLLETDEDGVNILVGGPKTVYAVRRRDDQYNIFKGESIITYKQMENTVENTDIGILLSKIE